MSNKFTPGPWRVAYVDKNGQSVIMGEHIELATCWHHCVGSIEREMHHNAQLMAAAPDLLEACMEMANGYSTRGSEMARAAIAKAVGATS